MSSFGLFLQLDTPMVFVKHPYISASGGKMSKYVKEAWKYTSSQIQYRVTKIQEEMNCTFHALTFLPKNVLAISVPRIF